MSYVGLLMVREENDILERVLAEHERIVDTFYVLDGTTPNKESRAICEASPKCAGYWTDADLPRPPYPEGTTCGYRGFIYDQAVAEIGWDHWFLELHGDEIWTFHPDQAIAGWPEADGFGFRLPFYFPREPWQDDVHALDQLHWRMEPGWPEFRMFKGNPDVAFNPIQHYDTQPHGLHRTMWTPMVIKHYPYRSPAVQRKRAAIHEQTRFDPGNYQHIVNDDQVIWTDEMIEAARCAHHTELVAA